MQLEVISGPCIATLTAGMYLQDNSNDGIGHHIACAAPFPFQNHMGWVGPLLCLVINSHGISYSETVRDAWRLGSIRSNLPQVCVPLCALKHDFKCQADLYRLRDSYDAGNVACKGNIGLMIFMHAAWQGCHVLLLATCQQKEALANHGRHE